MTLQLALSRPFRAWVSFIMLGRVSSLHAVQVYVDATADAGGNTYNGATNSFTNWK